MMNVRFSTVVLSLLFVGVAANEPVHSGDEDLKAFMAEAVGACVQSSQCATERPPALPKIRFVS
jgi:hypothetical protein